MKKLEENKTEKKKRTDNEKGKNRDGDIYKDVLSIYLRKVYNETKSQNKLQKYGWVGKKKFGQNKKLVRKNATTGLCVSVEKRVF